MNRNSNVEVRITVTATGETWVERYRASFGSYCNMLDRVALRIDGTTRPNVGEVDGDTAHYETLAGTEFTTGPVLTEADRVGV